MTAPSHDHSSPSDDAAPPELRALAEPPASPAPSPGFERRLVTALGDEGLLAPAARSQDPLRLRVARLAAAAIVFALGMGAGATLWSGAPAALDDGGPAYLLLLSSPDTVPLDAATHRARVAEYGAWARRLAEQGRLVHAAPLDDGGVWLRPTGDGVETQPYRAPAEAPNGYFILRAAGIEEALDLARQCPHLRHGGQIDLRPLRSE